MAALCRRAIDRAVSRELVADLFHPVAEDRLMPFPHRETLEDGNSKEKQQTKQGRSKDERKKVRGGQLTEGVNRAVAQPARPESRTAGKSFADQRSDHRRTRGNF